LRKDLTGHKLVSVLEGASGYNPIRVFRGHAGQTQELLFGGVIQVERMIASPAFVHALSYGFRILFQL
jgi:hypothetical protein